MQAITVPRVERYIAEILAARRTQRQDEPDSYD